MRATAGGHAHRPYFCRPRRSQARGAPWRPAPWSATARSSR